MRNLRVLDAYRILNNKFYKNDGDDTCGVFYISSPTDRQEMCVVASSGAGWDHVSVSRTDRCPNWTEMEHVKRLFFRDDETAMQLHVPPSEHRSLHPYCLHMWRPLDCKIPRPPADHVAPENVG